MNTIEAIKARRSIRRYKRDGQCLENTLHSYWLPAPATLAHGNLLCEVKEQIRKAMPYTQMLQTAP